jgi:hypothetical protein
MTTSIKKVENKGKPVFLIKQKLYRMEGGGGIRLIYWKST